MKKFWCNGKKDFCDTSGNCINCEHYANLGGAEIEVKEIKTNYDKITSSVEILAEIMDNYRWCPYFLNSTCDSEIECIECITEWLQKESDES